MSAPSSRTLVDLLDRAAALDAAQPGDSRDGLRFLDRHLAPRFYSWGEIYRAARKVAGSLAHIGVEPGERVALVFPTGLEFFHAFFGVMLAGAVPTPLYPPVRLGRLDEYHQRTAGMLDAASARLMLTDQRVHKIIGPTVGLARLPLGCLVLTELPEAGETQIERRPDDLALVQFSSGTTVAPKPVALEHRHIVAQVEALNRFWPDDATIRHSGVSWLPLYHDMGLIGCVFPALERPTSLTLIGPEVFVTRPSIWLRAISTYRATVSVAPNFAYGLCVEKITDDELEGVDLSSWRVALNGAEAVSAEVLRSFERRFAAWGFRREALTPVYGLSEATLAVTFSDLESGFTSRRFDSLELGAGRAVESDNGRELISVGRPLAGTEIRVVDGSGVEVAEGVIGELQVRGPSVMRGYLDRPEATASSFTGEWLHTGDLGFIHQGELFLSGRAKDLLIVRGRNIVPHEVEQAVDPLAATRTGCAVAVADIAEREQVLLFVEAKRDATAAERAALPDACRRAVRAAVGIELDAVHVLAPGTLPRTSSGKLRRGETLKRHLAGQLHAPKRVTPLRLFGAMARSSLSHARDKRRRTSSTDPESDRGD